MWSTFIPLSIFHNFPKNQIISTTKPKTIPIHHAETREETLPKWTFQFFITIAENGGVLWAIADTWSDRTSSNLFERKSDFKTTQAIVYYGINTKSICFDLGENEIEWNTYDCHSTESNQDHAQRMSDDKKKIKKTGRKKAHTHFESKRERNDHKVDARNHAIEILYSEPIHTKKKNKRETENMQAKTW